MSSTFSKVGKSATVKLCELPEPIRSHAFKLDTNNDGELSINELANAIDDLYLKRRKNKGLKKTVIVCVFLTIVLIGGIFGATLAGAILSKDFVIDNEGFAKVKGSTVDMPMKTKEAIHYSRGQNIGKMTNEELMVLAEITINDDNLKFYVQGHARDKFNDQVILLVNGGTITYDEKYIVDATGDARRMLESSMGLDEFYPHPTDRRWLEDGDGNPTRPNGVNRMDPNIDKTGSTLEKNAKAKL